MCRFGISLIGVFAVALAACAQSAGQPAPTDNLDTVLHGWEKAMTGLKRFVLFSERSTKGGALNIDESPMKFIWTDKELYEFSATERKVCIYDVSQIKQVVAQTDSPLTLLFGMSAEQAKSRYIMELKGSDKYYYYIRILPRQKQAAGEFTEVRLSLIRATYLPAQIWYHHAGSETTWDISKVQVDMQFPFRPAIPEGWTVERILPEAPARKEP